MQYARSLSQPVAGGLESTNFGSISGLMSNSVYASALKGENRDGVKPGASEFGEFTDN